MKFTVIGKGFVGKAVGDVLSDKHTVSYIDPELGDEDTSEKYNSNGFVICVPTPPDEVGRCDDILVREYVDKILEYDPLAHILIKSTTSVPTLSELNYERIAFSPEFLRGSVGAEPSAEFRNCKFAIFGGYDGRWWYEVFNDILHLEEVRFLDIESAGFLKYAENSFLATKVMFFNELENLYQNTIGLTTVGNYDAMIEALALDKRIGFSHTQVPGPDGKYGFGGHCLPKDTSEFVRWAEENESNLKILELVRYLNFQSYRDK